MRVRGVLEASALMPMTALWLVGCGNVQVRPLATGALERPAYELAGRSLDSLRDEARRLCPNGAEVMRAAQRIDGAHGASSLPAEHWYSRWWQATRMTVAPAHGEAQLVVLCQPVTGASGLAAAPASTAPSAPARATAADADAAHDLRSGMTAALPAAAVNSARPGRAPATIPAPGGPRPASAPVLTY